MTEASWIFDACVRPRTAPGRDVREYMPRPWSGWLLPDEGQFYHPIDGDELLISDASAGNPAMFCEHLAGTLRRESGADHVAAVLVPEGRGLLPNVDQGAELASAINRWQYEEWLASPQSSIRLFGSIRVEPRHPARAVAEIERWAGEESFVQVVVPLQASAPYGKREYADVWAAAAAHDLPICIASDGGWGIEFPATGAGHPQTPAEFAVLNPINFAYHAASMVAEGSFSRHPDLRVVAAGGGVLMNKPIAWRMDKDWRTARDEVPWVTEPPSHTLASQLFLVTNCLDWPPDEDVLADWAGLEGQTAQYLFGSNFPSWDAGLTGDFLQPWPEASLDSLTWRAAASLYKLDLPVGVS